MSPSHDAYPAGGGRLAAHVNGGSLCPVDMLERGEIVKRRARALVANLPFDIAERQVALVRKRRGLGESEARGETIPDSPGPGNVLLLELAWEQAAEIICSFGSKTRSAEAVAEDAVQKARRFLAARVPVGEHLADQLLIPLALAGGGSFRTLAPSRHCTTNAEVIRNFVGMNIRFEREEAGTARCDVRPA
jgi:RNA 3'-terminal phosphate cyclase (ATP)